MQNSFFAPEGSLLHTEENRQALFSPESIERARSQGAFFEARAMLCDTEHNLTVDLNGIRGIIPHDQTAAGIDNGQTREIAVISKVGKPVCFQVESGVLSGPDGPYVLLSRRAVQERALAHFLTALHPGDVIGGVITHIEPFGVFVDIGCGIISFISIENISVSRINHPLDRFSQGQRIYAAVLSVDKKLRRITLTHKELLGTWEENAALFAPGQTVTGLVRGIEEYGIFIELAPNLSGLAEKFEGAQEGQPVSVYIKSIVPQRMKFKLAIIDLLGKDGRPPKQLRYFISSGHIDRWEYSPESCPVKKIETVFK